MLAQLLGACLSLCLAAAALPQPHGVATCCGVGYVQQHASVCWHLTDLPDRSRRGLRDIASALLCGSSRLGVCGVAIASPCERVCLCLWVCV